MIISHKEFPNFKRYEMDYCGRPFFMEVGKMADVAVWNRNPFSVYAHAEQVYVDGARVYDRADSTRQPKSDFMLGQSLPRTGSGDAAMGGAK